MAGLAFRLLESLRAHPGRDPRQRGRQFPAAQGGRARPGFRRVHARAEGGGRFLRRAAGGGGGHRARADEGRPCGCRRTASSATCGWSATRNIPTRCTISPAARSTTSRCATARWNAAGPSTNTASAPRAEQAARPAARHPRRGGILPRAWAWTTSRPNCGKTSARSRPPRISTLPELIELDNLRGTFHCHTNASDGHNTLEEMAEAAQELGLQYLGHRRPQQKLLPGQRPGRSAARRAGRGDPAAQRAVRARQGGFPAVRGRGVRPAQGRHAGFFRRGAGGAGLRGGERPQRRSRCRRRR